MLLDSICDSSEKERVLNLKMGGYSRVNIEP